MWNVQDKLSWIARALGVDRASSKGMDFDSPSTVLDSIQATVSAQGWQHVSARPGRIFVQLPGPVSSVPSPDVPGDETWLVYAANVRQSGGAGANIRLDVFDRRVGGGAALTDTVNASNNAAVALSRPILLVPGQILSAEALTAVVLGQTFTLEALFFILEPGEYFPGGPYG